MKATNLRIGNKVDLYGNTATIQGADFVKHYSAGNENFNRFKPIELNEEWLLSFEFTLDKSGYYVNRAFHCFVGNTKLTKGKIILATNFDKTIIIEYVHQLQNLFFALMNEELELKVLM